MNRYLVISSDTHAGPPSEAYRDYVDPQYREAFDNDLADRGGHAFGHPRVGLRGAAALPRGMGGGDRRWRQTRQLRPRRAQCGARQGGHRGRGDLPRCRRARWRRVRCRSAPGCSPRASSMANSSWLVRGRTTAGWPSCARTAPSAAAAWPPCRSCMTSPRRWRRCRRVAERGCGHMIPTLWGVEARLPRPVYEPVWAAAEDLGLVVNIHSGGSSKDILPGPGMVPHLRHRGVVVGGSAALGAALERRVRPPPEAAGSR